MDLDDVQDPSDFPLDNLRKLDGSLRCPICQDLFDGPIILHCGHTFCSLCIRNLLPTKPECPKCRAPAKEAHIVRNATFEDAVTAWSECRAQVLQFANDSVRPCPSPSSKLTRGTKRKISEQDSGPEAGPSKLVRRGGDKSQDESYELQDGDHLNTNDGNQVSVESIVVCPLCNRDVVMKNINSHMDDGCKKFVIDIAKSSTTRQNHGTTSIAAWNSIFRAPPKKQANGYSAEDYEIPIKKLAKVSYGTLKPHELRKLLAEHGLSTAGERQELIQRHQRWIAIYNANSDRGRPKPLGDLKRELQDMEEVKSRPGPKKVLDGKEYARKNGAQFASLIEKARPKSRTILESTSTENPIISPNSGPRTGSEESLSPRRTTADLEID